MFPLLAMDQTWSQVHILSLLNYGAPWLRTALYEECTKLNAFAKTESQPASETQYSIKNTRWAKSKENYFSKAYTIRFLYSLTQICTSVTLLFYTAVIPGHLHQGKNTGCASSTTQCWGRYLGLTGLTGGCRKLQSHELHNIYSSPILGWSLSRMKYVRRGTQGAE